MTKPYRALGLLAVGMSLLFSLMSWAAYSLWIEYRAYRAYAETELRELNTRIMDVQVDLIRIKSTCNSTTPVYPDSGNDFSQ